MNNPATAVAAIAASAALLNGAYANADTAANPLPAGQHTLGGPAQIGDSTWTVSDLKPSSDTLPYRPAGTLWEATATDEATHSSATPIVSNFNARAHSGQTYRELFGVASAQGVNPAGLAQGQKVTGKLYFDVTGDAPDSVTYNAGGPDLALWVQPPPSAGSGGSARTIAPAATQTPQASTPASPAVQPAGHPGGSAGTVIPGATPAAPAPGTTPGSQPPTSGNPASAGTPAQAPGEPAPANTPPSPAPAGVNSGPPPEPAPQGPSGLSVGPAPAGSQGTPLPPGTEQTPPSPANPQPAPAPAPAANTQPSPSPIPAPPTS